MRIDETTYDTLIYFDCELGCIACENIIKEMDELLIFDHSNVIEEYDNEDHTYDIFMYAKADDDVRKLIKVYLDNQGFKDKYSIRDRYCN